MQPSAGARADTDADPESTARSIVLRLLTGAPRSRHQLAEALTRRGIEEAVVERVLDRFTDVGLIDDAEYAQMLVRSQLESRGLARRALAVELQRKGVGADEAEAALSTVSAEDEEQRARDLLRKRWATGARLDPEVRARRAMGMLARKGYPMGLASRLVREMVDDGAQEPWEPTVDDLD
ncbi:regulatory protein RecX [Actinotalea sp. K2]|uniref:regulatory protein RecX n=1 Tax=Actinotalea sp. K2 TaxID=2939438 RepID=UPI00201733CC|nr:regulatory protein RecX [Actinotalea sp. K2]MCL3860169.1 recombination regulator RecX [Actinotalea sp. K2]